MSSVLVVDDQPAQCKILTSILKSAGHDVTSAGSVEEAVNRLQTLETDIVLTDLSMPGQSGIDLIEKINTLNEPPEVIVMTAYASIETAVKAIRLGAYDYLTKPLDQTKLLKILDQAIQKKNSKKESLSFRSEMKVQLKADLVSQSPAMKGILDILPRIAASDSTVLIRGESGTGKEKIARAIHLLSTRGSHVMQAVNCAAFPESLLESELFGYEKGAFTGAQTRKTGIIEAASQSTLFLDEVADMPPSLQVKLLRVLQEKEIRRLGSTENLQVDFRLVTATNRPLEELIKNGIFREDLYYRLNVIPILLPPLRERREDIVPLIEFFLIKKRLQKSFSKEALEILSHYSWPGNVRELEALVERLAVLCPSQEIGLKDLPPELLSEHPVKTDSSQFILGEQGVQFDDLEKQILVQALQKSNGVMADAAKLLGMTYRTFQYRAQKFGIRESKN